MNRITFLVCAFFICASATAGTTNFMVNLASAKHKAAIEGKLYMVHFTASWCTPCKWMNSHTFTDDRVAGYLTENYVSVKIDVEDFDGIIIKQKNNVQFLPTLLIFNSKGEEVGRFEEAIGPSKLMAILEENNIPNNKEKIDLPEPAAAENPSAISRPLLPSIFDDSEEVVEPNIEIPSPIVQEETEAEVDKTEINIPVYTPPVNENNVGSTSPIASVDHQAISSVESTDLGRAESSESTTPLGEDKINSESRGTAAESLAFLTGEGIFELDVRFKQKQGYSVQIGLYARYENVLAEVNKFKNMYNEKVFVHIGKMNGVPVYRLLMGSFDHRQDASQFEYQLKDRGLDCFVSDLSRL